MFDSHSVLMQKNWLAGQMEAMGLGRLAEAKGITVNF